MAYELGLKVSIVTTLKVGLVVGARSMLGNLNEGQTLHEALEQAEILANTKAERIFINRGYRGADITGVQVWMSDQRRGVTRSLKAKIKRRCDI